jgi:hypothetical protein
MSKYPVISFHLFFAQVVTRRIETRTREHSSSASTTTPQPPLLPLHRPPPERRTGDRRSRRRSETSMDSRRGEQRRQAWPEPEEGEQSKAWQEEQLSLHLQELQADKENQSGRPKKVINSVNWLS